MADSSNFIIAIDFGLTHIGLAVGQRITNSASGLTTLKANNGRPNWNEMDKLIEEYSPSLLLVGFPLNMDGSKSEMTEKAEKFAALLRKRTLIPTCLVDERLSSKEAINIANGSKKIHGYKATIHEISACLIAQTWLDEN
jgi:putative Holliday junction resolvase